MTSRLLILIDKIHIWIYKMSEATKFQTFCPGIKYKLMKMTNSCYCFGLLSTVVVTTQSLNCNNLFTSQATITSKNIQNSIYFRCITQNLFQRQFQNWKNSMKFTNFYIQKKNNVPRDLVIGIPRRQTIVRWVTTRTCHITK